MSAPGISAYVLATYTETRLKLEAAADRTDATHLDVLAIVAALLTVADAINDLRVQQK